MNISVLNEVPPTTDPSVRKARQRACASCSKTKAKCDPGFVNGEKCQRCSRLNRSCEPLPSRTRAKRTQRPHQDNHVSKDHVAALEEKLDGLVSILKTTQDESSAKASWEQPFHTPATTARVQLVNKGQDEDATTWDDRLFFGGTMQQRYALPPEEFLQLQKPAALASRQTTTGITIEINLGDEDPNALLNIFRSEMIAFCPVVVIPNHVMANELRQTRPELFVSIMAVTTRVTSQQKNIPNTHLRDLSARVIVDGERSLDILSAVLTYAAWSYHHFFNNVQFTSLLSLARLLVADLKLNRSTLPGEPGPRSKALRVSQGSGSVGNAKSVDEHRALVCYWYLNSNAAAFFHKLDLIPWGPYLEESFQALAASSDRDNRRVAALTKIQLITERITQSPWHDELVVGNNAPPALYLHSSKQQLDEIGEAFATEINENVAIFLSYKNAQISLYKIGLSKALTLSNRSSLDFDRIHCLHTCLQAVESFVHTYLNIPTSKIPCLTVPILTHFTWSLGVLQLLTTFEHPDWNLEWARSTISLTDVLGRLYEKYTQVKTTIGLDRHTPVGEDIFSHSARRLTWMKSFFENGGTNSRLQDDDQQYRNLNFHGDLSLGGDIDLMNDEWFRDLMDLW